MQSVRTWTELGARVARARSETGLSIDQVSETAELSSGRLQAIEAGDAQPLAAELRRIARILGVGITRFFEDP